MVCARWVQNASSYPWNEFHATRFAAGDPTPPINDVSPVTLTTGALCPGMAASAGLLARGFMPASASFNIAYSRLYPNRAELAHAGEKTWVSLSVMSCRLVTVPYMVAARGLGVVKLVKSRR